MKTLAVTVFAIFAATPALAAGPTLQGMHTGENHALPNGGRMAHPVPFPPIRNWNSLVITLDRGACFGTCPIYRVIIHGNGRVAFLGQRFVAHKGRHETRISRRAVHQLFDKFRRAEYFSLLDGYHARVTDIPAFTTSISYDGHEKQVVDYGGHFIGMPDVVNDLERAIDDAADSQRWIKGPNSRYSAPEQR